MGRLQGTCSFPEAFLFAVQSRFQCEQSAKEGSTVSMANSALNNSLREPEQSSYVYHRLLVE